MADIEKSFTHLHQNIPQWLQSIAEIDEKVARMQTEMAKVPVSRAALKKKTGSVESIRDLDAMLDRQDTPPAAAPQSPSAGQKRKSPSVRSGHASGPSKYRTRNMILVYYDGQIQKQLELLVRNIGTGRNLLRKGKMAAKLENLADLAGSDDSSEGDDGAETVLSKIGYRHRTGLSAIRGRSTPGGYGIVTNPNSAPIEVFETTDKALELAQGLCERAAHQSLRDGDCRKEMDSVRSHFQEVLETATKEMKRCIAQREKTGAEAKLREQQSTQEATNVVNISLPDAPSTQAVPELLPSKQAAPFAIPPASSNLAIEIDEDDDDDMDFAMPPIRLTSRT